MAALALTEFVGEFAHYIAEVPVPWPHGCVTHWPFMSGAGF